MRPIGILFVLLLWTTMHAFAQDCAALLQTALASTRDLCAETGRNEMCYGNGPLEVGAQEGSNAFAAPTLGARERVRRMGMLRLGVTEAGVGMALLNLQADLPNQPVEQNATLLAFGDVEIHNGVAAEAAPPEIRSIVIAGLNVRSGPGTEYTQIGSLLLDQIVTGVARSEDSSWMQIQLPWDENATGWVSTQVGALEIGGDVSTLPNLGETDQLAVDVRPQFSPMQSFTFSSTDTPCVSGILLQAPASVGEVMFDVNGVSLRLNGTVFLQAQLGGDLVLNVLEGRAQITANDSPVTALSGTQVLVPTGAFPDAPIAYDEAQMQALPVSVLTREITAAPARTEALGTGEVQVTLTWNNAADLDLYVREPAGDVLYYAERVSPTGGILDVDSNYPCGTTPNSVENAFWGTAPSGTYEVYIRQYDDCDAEDAEWTLTVRVDGETVLEREGVGVPQVLQFFR